MPERKRLVAALWALEHLQLSYSGAQHAAAGSSPVTPAPQMPPAPQGAAVVPKTDWDALERHWVAPVSQGPLLPDFTLEVRWAGGGALPLPQLCCGSLCCVSSALSAMCLIVLCTAVLGLAGACLPCGQ